MVFLESLLDVDDSSSILASHPFGGIASASEPADMESCIQVLVRIWTLRWAWTYAQLPTSFRTPLGPLSLALALTPPSVVLV